VNRQTRASPSRWLPSPQAVASGMLAPTSVTCRSGLSGLPDHARPAPRKRESAAPQRRRDLVGSGAPGAPELAQCEGLKRGQLPARTRSAPVKLSENSARRISLERSARSGCAVAIVVRSVRGRAACRGRQSHHDHHRAAPTRSGTSLAARRLSPGPWIGGEREWFGVRAGCLLGVNRSLGCRPMHPSA